MTAGVGRRTSVMEKAHENDIGIGHDPIPVARVPWWRRWIYAIPAVMWAGLIFYLSAQPSLGVGGPWDTLLRKGAHFTVFAVLTGLIYVAWKAGRVRLLETEKMRAIIGAIVISALYAVSDELHQAFVPARQPAIFDLLIDGLGIAAMAWAIKKGV